MRPRLLLVLLAAAIAIAGCGGGEESESLTVDEYRSMLDAECADVTAKLEALPQRQQDEGLSSDETEALGTEIGDEFEAFVNGLEPPDELAAPHDALVAAFDDELPDPGNSEELRIYVTESAQLYADLGAGGCEAIQLESLNELPGDAAN